MQNTKDEDDEEEEEPTGWCEGAWAHPVVSWLCSPCGAMGLSVLMLICAFAPRFKRNAGVSSNDDL